MDWSDDDIICYALSYWANHVETGNMVMSRNDAIRQNKHACIRDLSNEQMEMVRRLRKLSNDQIGKNS